MLIDIPQPRLQLSKDGYLTLRGACGTRLTAISGTAWITVDRDVSDYIVSAGESFIVPSERSVFVVAMSPQLTLEAQSASDAKLNAGQPPPTLAERLRTLRKLVVLHFPERTPLQLESRGC